MATEYSNLLGLALPVTGELDGTWGDTVNNGITQLIEDALAGTTTLSSDADVTLTTTEGGSNQARAAVLLWTASGTTTRNITAPAQSKAYIVINATGSTQSIVIRGAGPTTGVTVPAGKKALVAWNGSDFVSIASTSIVLTTDVTGTLPVANGGTGSTTLTANYVLLGNGTAAPQLVAPGASGNILRSTGTTWESATPASGGTVTEVTFSGGTTGLSATGSPVNTSGGFVLGGTLVVANGGTGSTTLTANNVLLGNGTAAVQAIAPSTSGNVLTSNGTTWLSSPPAYQGTVTSVSFSGGTTGLTASGGPVTGSGGFTLSGTLAVANGGTGVTTSTGSGNTVLSTSPTLVTPALGTPSAAVLTNATGLPLTTGVTGTLPVANGGTGAATFTANNVLLGNGTSALQTVAPSTSGNVLSSNGTTWLSSAVPAPTQTRSTKTGAYTVVAGDKGNLIDCTSGSFTVDLTAASTLGTSFWFDIANSGSGNILFDAAGADTIDGLANYYLYPGEKRRVFCTSTSTFVSLVMSPFSFTATASGDWIEPPGYKLFQGLLWAAGGGGGRVANASFIGGGGGGGACVPLLRVAASAGSTVSFTLATATTNQTSAAAGASGGNSTFGGVTAYGGGGGYGANGVSGVGGGGGGALSAGTVGGTGTAAVAGGRPGTEFSGNGYDSDGLGGAMSAGMAAWGGGGGGGNSSTVVVGGNAVFGGGGGGRGSTTNATAGSSVYGGAGGAGGNGLNGTDGTAPGGGGGGTNNGTQGGAGARGELRLWGVV